MSSAAPPCEAIVDPAPARAGVKVFFDGGCRGDDGRMEVAVVMRGHVTIRSDRGHGTSSDAEWLALIEALTIARASALPDVILIGDSADVVAKANGRIPCRGREAAHLERFRALAADAGRIRVRHIRRAQNLAGIALDRRYPR